MPPYGRSCDLPIKGVECIESMDDGECYLYLTKKKVVYSQIKVLRQKIDFATSKIKWPVDIDNAVFSLESKDQFPKVQLFSPVLDQ